MRKVLIGFTTVAILVCYGFKDKTATANEFKKTVEKILERDSDAIVFVSASVPQPQQNRGMMRGRRGQQQQRMVERPFTGVLLDKEGTIVISAYRIDGDLEDIKVTLVSDKENSYSARMISLNRSYNLYFIRLSEEEVKQRKPKLKPVELGKKVEFYPGEELIEIGRHGQVLGFAPAVLRNYVHTIVNTEAEMVLTTAQYSIRPLFKLNGDFVGISTVYIVHTPDMAAHVLYAVIDPHTLENRYKEAIEEMKEMKN